MHMFMQVDAAKKTATKDTKALAKAALMQKAVTQQKAVEEAKAPAKAPAKGAPAKATKAPAPLT